MRVTVLGTGIMGAGMALSLAREGHDVVVWNRSPDKAAALVGDRIRAAATVAEAVSGAEAVVTVLYDAEAVLGVADELLAALDADAVWVQASTVGVDGIAAIVQAAGGAAVRLIDAPVLGTRKPAEDGLLTVLAAGAPAALATAQPVLDAIGARTIVAGDEVGRATALKLVCNSWVATVNTGAAQALSLASSLDLDPALFLDAIKGGALDVGYVHVKGALMQSGDWSTPSFALDGVRKDLALMLSATREAPGFLAAMLALYDDASRLGLGGADMAAVRAAFNA